MGIQLAKMEDLDFQDWLSLPGQMGGMFLLWHFEWRKKHVESGVPWISSLTPGLAHFCEQPGDVGRLGFWSDWQIWNSFVWTVNDSDTCWPDSSLSSPLYFTSSWGSDQPHVFWPRHRGICFFWVPKSTQRRTPLNAFWLRTRVARMPSRQKHVYTYGLW